MIHWYTDLNTPPQDCSPQQWQWLIQADSLTARLERVGGEKMALKLLSADWQKPIAEEQTWLSEIKPDDMIWVREIVHTYQEQPWVWARTLIPETTIKATNIDAKTTEPIGRILFREPTLKRDPFAWARLSAEHPYTDMMRAHHCDLSSLPWLRRSVFWYQGYPLLIVEAFLSVFFNAQKEHVFPE